MDDPFGQALVDWAQGGTSLETIERDDGFTAIGAGPEVYLAPFREWPLAERQALEYVSGRVLDVGCGSGRVALHLQRRGVDVVGLDASALAVTAATVCGVNEVWCTTVDALGRRITSFDTLVMFGNNFGIFGTPDGARRRLTEWARRTKSTARVVVESTNPYCGGAPAFDRGYYQRNRARGLYPGQANFRYHYDHLVGPWFRWIFVSRREMHQLLRGTGWRIEHVVGERPSEPYVAILVKE